MSKLLYSISKVKLTSLGGFGKIYYEEEIETPPMTIFATKGNLEKEAVRFLKLSRIRMSSIDRRIIEITTNCRQRFMFINKKK